jgi:hypothetical protein
VKKELKNTAFADDAMHPISRPCVEVLFKIYEDFGKASGSEVNVSSSRVTMGNLT